MKRAFFYNSPFGRLGIAEEDDALSNIFFKNTVVPKSYALSESPLLKETAQQLEEYFGGRRTTFELPLAPKGTPFECDVWNLLLKIPYGETVSYAHIAQALDEPKAYRAVGRANGLNPISIVIPCHRVIGTNGSLTGYAGGLEMKKALLTLEGAI